MNHDKLVEYIKSLQPGERVIETERNCFYKRQGTIYISEYQGRSVKCVMWDKYEGEEGQMGTSVTGGTRRLNESRL